MRLFLAALVALVLFVGVASAQQCGGNRNFGLRQAVIGNQIVTFDRFGNVVDRDFVNRGRGFIQNRSLLNLNLSGFAGRSLSERLLFGF